jgi:hypothetical protein
VAAVIRGQGLMSRQAELQVQQPNLRLRQPELQQRKAQAGPRPASAATRLAPDQWAELAPGEAVWVESAGYGFEAGYVDVVSQHQEIIWVDFAVRGRRLLCSGDPMHVWTSDLAGETKD